MKRKSIWVFGDYRNYFQNRVTLQLLARAKELAPALDAEVCALLLGHEVDEYAGEYIAHGAEKVYVCDHPRLKEYAVETYSLLAGKTVRKYAPEILLIGATRFGRELAPRLAKGLNTGLTADCIALNINAEGLLVQTAPSFGGSLLAEIVTPKARPQMATVRPGTFPELPHDYAAAGDIVRIPLPENLPTARVRLLHSERIPQREQRLEDADIVICGGRGMGSKTRFKKLFELARLTEGEVGATRPVVYAGWTDHNALIGQAGKQISPKVLFSFGISGAIQHTAAINDAGLIIAVNKNPNAAMMKIADVAIVADANQFCSALIRELKKRIRD
ncbi:MAG: electron transfer flavoprotein subunit alpha/FixB family protein [Desulfococcaceae bacterium]|jgi:electron transfer flavoprotein alpha subunit|nr:electron transfer flavoprotein subunit alpha/FixB family protein [Desulfococcaceae bacterium]